ncbi:MAG: GNAT family N-acetyltransferase [Bacteroidota bacterium]
MFEGEIKVVKKEKESEIPFELLLLADPSLELLKTYLKQGSLFQAEIGQEIVGVVLLLEINLATLEVKNIAVAESHQGKGLGKELLKFSEAHAIKEGYSVLRIATGNSSIGQLALYQKMGFEISDIQKGFFTRNYQDPIWEHGIQCKHLLVLEKRISISPHKSE